MKPGFPLPSRPAAELLAGRGLRSTRARLEVLDVLSGAREALTHHGIEQRLKRGQDIDRVTLYRVLDWLVEQGLAHKLAGEDRIWRFSVVEHGTAAGARARHAHAHFECSRCGRVICLADATVPVVTVPSGYRRDEVEVTVKGSCDRCSSAGG